MIRARATLTVTFAACILAAACSPQPEREAPPPTAAVTETSDPLDNFPAADQEMPEGAVPHMISPLAAGIDRTLGSATVRTATLDPDQPGWDERVIRGWFVDDGLIRLSVTEPTDSGRMSGETVFYLENAEVRVVRRPEAILILRPNGSIERWLDDQGNPVDASATRREEQSRELAAAFKRWRSALIDSSPEPAVQNPVEGQTPD